jgi:N4-gp56 family major capsid protein
MSLSYNAPADGTDSGIGPQIRTDFYKKKALIELKKEQYFVTLADTTTMPKHFGKKIKQFHYMPLLDDRNINDEGIDAAGATLTSGTYSAVDSTGTIISSGHATAAIAYAVSGCVSAIQDGGNLYGSSKDVGSITSKLPIIGEHGGRVNRVGFKRIELEGTFEKFGFFDEYTADSVNFDTDEEMLTHVNREMIRGANEMNEDALQIDLLNAAATIRYAGEATEDAEISGETGSVCEVTYDDLMRLDIDLDDNRTPKHTTMITGSRMVDTRVIQGARIMYIGSELRPTLERMKDLHDERAFIKVAQYASAGDVIQGEIGAVGPFRVVVVPEMMHWDGIGADEATANEGYRTTNGKYNVYPMLVVGDASFTCIGFQTDGETVKFQITHKPPGKESADRTDPYGETGFMSIKWWYGFMGLRTERIALIKTVAEI